MNRIFVITRKTVWALVGFWFFVIILSVILCLFSVKAHAGGHSLENGYGLLIACDSENEVRQRSCMSYITGIIDGIAFQRGYTKGVIGVAAFAEHGPALQHYCFIEGVTMGHVIMIIKNYLLDNTSSLHYNSVALIRRALNAALPCK